MKKNLVITAVAVLALGQAVQAAGGKGGRETRPDGEIGRAVEKSKDAAAKDALKGADSQTPSKLMSEIKAAKLDTKLSVNEITDLGKVIGSNAEARAGAESAVEQSKSSDESVRALGAARIGAIARLGKVKNSAALATLKTEDAVIEQAYVNLALNAGKLAEGWESVELRKNMTFLLEKTNELVASGRSVVEAMKEANEIIARPPSEGGRSVRLKFEDVNKYCKKA